MEVAESAREPGALPETPAARRPMVGFCLAALAGWLTGFHFAPDPLYLLPVAGILLAIPLLRSSSALATPAVHLAALVAAATHASLFAAPPAPAHFEKALEKPREFIEIIGTVADEPSRLDRPGAEAGPWVFTLDVEGVRRTTAWQHSFGRIEVRWNAPSNAVPPAYGQQRHLAGVVSSRSVRRAADAWQLQSRGSSAVLALDTRSRFYSWCLQQRQRASAALSRGLAGDDFAVQLAMARALVLGERTELDDRVRKAFARTGTLHVVAISGSHVAVFLSLLTALFKALGRPRTAWLLYASPFLILYTIATGLSASAVRACIMALVFLAAPFFRRKVDAATALAVAALFILAAAPPQLFDPGFLLSFLVVGGLMAFYRGILRILERWLPGDPWQLELPTPVKVRRAAYRAVAALFAASLAAWLVSAPLTAAFFHLSSPVALVANLLVVPLAYFVLLSGCLSLSVGAIWAPLGEVFNHAMRVFVDLMLWSVELFDGIPGAYQYVQAPALAAILCYFAVLLAVFFGSRAVRRAAAGFGLLCVLGWTGWYFLNQGATIRWYGTGRTPTVFIDLPRDGDVLVNTGDRYQAAGLVRRLHAQGVDRLSALVLTRTAAEAMGGARRLLEEIPATEVIVPASLGRSKTFEAFAGYCATNGIPLRRVARPMSGSWAGGIRWAALHPGTNQYPSAEQGGLVLHVSRGAASLLIAGGIGPLCDAEVLASGIDPVCDVLLSTQRRGTPAWSASMLEAVRPLIRVEAAPTYSSDEAPGGICLVREDQIWTALLPAQRFQWLERSTGAISKDWKLTRTPWWAGELSSVDP